MKRRDFIATVAASTAAVPLEPPRSARRQSRRRRAGRSPITLLGTGTPAPSLTRQSSGYLIEVGSDLIVWDHGPAPTSG